MAGLDSREGDRPAETKLTYSTLDDINRPRPAFRMLAVCIIQVEVDDTTPVVRQHEKDVEHLEADGRHREEVHRDHGLDVILEEGPPGLRRRLAVARHVLADAGLANVDAQFEQFAVNPRWSR